MKCDLTAPTGLIKDLRAGSALRSLGLMVDVLSMGDVRGGAALDRSGNAETQELQTRCWNNSTVQERLCRERT